MSHLLNFVYGRTQVAEYLQEQNTVLRRFEASVLKEIKANNKSFERCILFQGAIAWNKQQVNDRNIATHKDFKKKQKKKLNTLFPYT